MPRSRNRWRGTGAGRRDRRTGRFQRQSGVSGSRRRHWRLAGLHVRLNRRAERCLAESSQRGVSLGPLPRPGPARAGRSFAVVHRVQSLHLDHAVVRRVAQRRDAVAVSFSFAHRGSARVVAARAADHRLSIGADGVPPFGQSRRGSADVRVCAPGAAGRRTGAARRRGIVPRTMSGLVSIDARVEFD